MPNFICKISAKFASTTNRETWRRREFSVTRIIPNPRFGAERRAGELPQMHHKFPHFLCVSFPHGDSKYSGQSPTTQLGHNMPSSFKPALEQLEDRNLPSSNYFAGVQIMEHLTHSAQKLASKIAHLDAAIQLDYGKAYMAAYQGNSCKLEQIQRHTIKLLQQETHVHDAMAQLRAVESVFESYYDGTQFQGWAGAFDSYENNMVLYAETTLSMSCPMFS